MPKKSVRLFRDRKANNPDNVKSSAARQVWKHAIDSAEETVSIMAAAFGTVFCELSTKTTTGFLTGWIFHWGNDAR
jgi:hypothetical protein